MSFSRDFVFEAHRQDLRSKPLRTTDRELHEYLKRRLGPLRSEALRAVFVGGGGRYLGDELISEGNGWALTVPCRKLFRRAFELDASAVVLAHNHPSGNAQASQHDIDVTAEIVRVGVLLEVAVLDHLIVTSRQVFSIKRSGLL